MFVRPIKNSIVRKFATLCFVNISVLVASLRIIESENSRVVKADT